jgi:outer membrane lipoprotein LolB
VNRAAVAVLASLWLGACAVVPPGSGPGRPPPDESPSDWTARGRMALAGEGEGGSGSFLWQQRAAETRVEIRGPLGAGALRIVATPGGLSVTDGAGGHLDPEAARAHLQARLGADVPWERLRYWMLGLPAPDAPSRVADATAAPWRVIEQSGWIIGYEAYVTTAGSSFPQRFTARRDGLRVKVIVDEWLLP